MHRRPPMNTPTADSGDALGGARAYGRVLHRAGGSEVEALARGRDPAALCVALYASPPYDLRVPALPVSRLSVTLTASRVFGGLDGERPREFETGRHALFLTPAGAATHWRKQAPSRHLNIYFRGDGLAEDGLGADPGLAVPLLNASLSGLRGIVDALVAELDGGDAHAVEAADSLARLLLVRLARRQAADRRHPQPLSPAGLARLREHVEAHMAERILVADMAAVLGLSANHFAHAFSARVGLSPHQYVLGLRLARALELLARTPLGLAEVAAACGFASQQHLSAQMRRRIGVTPARYRRSQRGD